MAEKGCPAKSDFISQRVFNFREAVPASFPKWVGAANAIGWRVESTFNAFGFRFL